MATREQTRRYRERDRKRLVQVRLSPEAVDWLDGLVSQRQASGWAEVLESILTGHSADPRTLACDGMRLVIGYFHQTGQTKVNGRHEDGGIVSVRFHPDPNKT
jgi:hypothetical protein